jgi:hypothetical protein
VVGPFRSRSRHDGKADGEAIGAVSVLTEAPGENDGRTPLLILCSRRPRFRMRSLDGRSGTSKGVLPWGRDRSISKL